MKSLRTAKVIALMSASALTPSFAIAQEGVDAFREEILVTATKKATEENIQEIPISVTAFGEKQIEALKIRDITEIGFSVPNAVIQPVGSFPGVGIFAIRGMTPTSSIPSLDPAVGTFVDGVYLPSNTGIILDAFDLESIEVLRGPQGVLFGRNVVGGAVLVNTKKPSDEFEAEFRARVDSGFRGTGANFTYSGLVTGPITDGLRAKVAVYHNDDNGWFENSFNGEKYGKSNTTLIRGALAFDLGDRAEFLISYEHGDQDADGPAGQSHDNPIDGNPGLFSRFSHDISLDLDTLHKAKWDQVIFTTNIDVGFGDGVITNIAGWRNYENEFAIDIDSSPNDTFHIFGGTIVESFSDELRYFGTFGDLEVTTGLYFLTSEITYQESRSLLGGAALRNGGGVQDAETFGIFGNFDYHVTDKVTVSAGVRYTHEEKEVETSNQSDNRTEQCGPVIGPIPCPIDFADSDSWSNVSYRFGAQYDLTETTMLYASASRSYRAGGYNVRRANFFSGRAPYNEERIDQYEIGIKSDLTDTVRLNVTGFILKGKDMQRVLNIPDPTTGTQQNVVNAADVDHYGIEVDARVFVTENLVLNAALGYLSAEYDAVFADLNGNGDLTDDLALEPPFIPDITAAVSLTHTLPIGDFGDLTSQIRYSHRDTRNNPQNTNPLPEQDLFDFNISLAPNDGFWELSLFGRNLTNEVNFTTELSLDPRFGSTMAPLLKGRQIGAEFILRFN